ncbi:MAG: 50S ribosomal protein L10, partial [Cyanobacteria bacterium]|nr:50S ribosomal protein L10 [Cyanobacteriota bacterium]
MAGLTKKKQTVEEIKEHFNQATIAVVTDYRGLTVAELTLLRNELFKEDAQFTVVKNTLGKRAIEGTHQEVLGEFLVGPTAITLGRGDQVKPV